VTVYKKGVKMTSSYHSLWLLSTIT